MCVGPSGNAGAWKAGSQVWESVSQTLSVPTASPKETNNLHSYKREIALILDPCSITSRFPRHCVIDPSVQDGLRPGIAHVRPVTSDNQILLVASHPHDEVVLDRKDGVFHAIDHEQLAAWTIQHSGLEQAKLLRVGGIRRHGSVLR